jgi:SMODS and SLOG-associating 2TM effector domain family 5
MRDYLALLQLEAWRTAGARYNAARRLQRRELFSTVSLALFSAASVGVAFLQRIYAPPGSRVDNYLTALSACIGVLLLTISLMEWGSRNGAKAEALHRNAEDLNASQREVRLLVARLDSGESIGWANVQTMKDRYEEIKARCSYNHDPIDDQLFLAAHRNAPEFQTTSGHPSISQWGAFLTKVHWYYASVWYFAIFWLVMIGTFALAFHLGGGAP